MGSLQSRAAARALLDQRVASQGFGVVFRVSVAGKHNAGPCTCSRPPVGTFAVCRCFA